MANKILTMEEVSRQMVRNINAICDREGIPEKDRARLAVLALNPSAYSPRPASQKQWPTR